MHLPLYLRICLGNEGKIDAAAVAKGPIEDSGDATMNLALIAFLCILSIQYILDNRWFSIRMSLTSNLIFIYSVFSSMILFADKLLISFLAFVYLFNLNYLAKAEQ